MTSTVLPPATASVPMVRAMFPVPMMLMLLMMRALFLVLELSLCLVCAGSGPARRLLRCWDSCCWSGTPASRLIASDLPLQAAGSQSPSPDDLFQGGHVID